MGVRDPRVWLHDIAEACRLIFAFTDGKTIDEYRADALVRSAVERQLLIIREALRRCVAEAPTIAVSIPGVPQIIGLRNRLAHGYGAIDDAVIYGVVESHIEELRRQVDVLLREADA